MLALPIASVQAVMLLLSSRIVERLAVADLLWTLAMFGAVAFTVVGAATRRRCSPPGAAGLLALLIFDEWKWLVASATPRTSHSRRCDSVLSPVALILIPTTLLLIAAGSLRPAAACEREPLQVRLDVGLDDVRLRNAAADQRDLATPSIIYSSLGVVALLTALPWTVFAVRRIVPKPGSQPGSCWDRRPWPFAVRFCSQCRR